MSMTTPSFHSDPHVQYLTQVLEEISDGFIQIPRFQRPLVWDWDRRLELLRSIRDGIPMGAIMVWRSNRTVIDCYEFLGPHKLEKPTTSTTTQYLLDGVQRLSTLYGALHPVSPEAQSDREHIALIDSGDDAPITENFEVIYDLRKKDFVRKDHTETGDEMMPLRIVFDSVSMLRFQRKLTELDDFEDLVSASESVAKAFREYKIPIIPIVTDSVEMATKTFQRINSQGEPMNEAHMIHALSWDGSFDLNRQLRDVKREFLLPVGWQGLDNDVIIKACKAKLGFDIYRTNADAVGHAFRRNPEVLNAVGTGFARAADFLDKYCGIPDPQLVPYTLQLVILADILGSPELYNNHIFLELRAWFWSTTYGEIFAGMSGDKFDSTLKSVRKNVAHSKFPYLGQPLTEVRAYPKRFDFRSVRAKAFGLRLADRRNQIMGNSSGTEILSEFGSAGLVQPLKRVFVDKSIYSLYSHRFLIHPQEAISFRAKLNEGSLSDEEMLVHFISARSIELLRADQHAEFLFDRLDTIASYDSEFLKEVSGMEVLFEAEISREQANLF